MSISGTNSMADRISSLPDAILSHIISFLPTENAVATSILSSRWKFIWRTTSNLSFCYGTDNNTDRFPNFIYFVNRILLLHDSKCIDKFSIDIRDSNVLYHYPTRELIESWISAAVARNVKVIMLRGFPDNIEFLRFELPSCAYTCNSLQVMHLSGVVIVNHYQLVCLPNLHTLRLEDVFIASDEALKKLLFGCSSLKTLYVLRGCNDRVATFTVTSPTLEHLTITPQYRSRDYDENHEERCIKLELDVPALKYLYIHDETVNDIVMEDMPSLLEAEIRLSFEFFKNQADVTGRDLSRSGLSPKFPRVTNLTLKVGFCKWSSLHDLLEGSDSLEYLTLNINLIEHLHASCWVKPQKRPAWFSCLKEMSIEDFFGSDGELSILGYFLENATKLETMKVTFFSHLRLSTRCQLIQKVSKIRRLSKMCEVIYN